jgi:hypothetical protein
MKILTGWIEGRSLQRSNVCALAFANIATARDTSSVGIIRSCGDCCPRRATPFHTCQRGRNSCVGVCSIGSHWTDSCRPRRERTKSLGGRYRRVGSKVDLRQRDLRLARRLMRLEPPLIHDSANSRRASQIFCLEEQATLGSPVADRIWRTRSEPVREQQHAT